MISVCILAKNSAATLRECLDSVRAFEEVLILDNGSTDNTIKIAHSYPNVKIIEAPFTGFGPMRNILAKLAKNDWILAIDTDEVLTAELLNEIRNLKLDPNTTYSISRANYYNGKHIKGCGWHPDRVTRLYHKQNTSYSNSQVHEAVIPLTICKLKSPLIHTPFRSTAEFIAKMQHYSSLYASQHHSKRSSFFKAFTHSLFAFLRSYFVQRGFLLGAEGFIISVYNSNSVFYKYLKLCEENSVLENKIE